MPKMKCLCILNLLSVAWGGVVAEAEFLIETMFRIDPFTYQDWFDGSVTYE